MLGLGFFGFGCIEKEEDRVEGNKVITKITKIQNKYKNSKI